MNKFIAILLLIGSVATGQAQQLNSNITNIDEYINQNKQQYAQNIRDYDQRMDAFRQANSASLQLILIHEDLIVGSIDQAEKKLNNLQTLSGLSQQCVNKYIIKLPNVIVVKQEIDLCFQSGFNTIDYLVISAYSTRTDLDSYYKYQFEGNLNSCKVQNGDYNTCVINAVSKANAYTDRNRKTFDSQMQTAESSGNANTDTAYQCSYKTQNRVTTSLTELNILIDNCLKGQDDCKPCTNQEYSCSIVQNLTRSEIDYNSPSMKNSFYRQSSLGDCVLLKISN